MKEKKKGFTLIELLAVIVILAIIALIATPIVLNLINKSREGAAKDSAYGVRKAAQLYYQTALLQDVNGVSELISISFNNGVVTVTPNNSNLKFELDGTKPTSGEIVIHENGDIDYGVLTINDYYCCIPATGEVNCSKTNSFDSSCKSTGGSSTNSGEENNPSSGDNNTYPKLNINWSNNGETYLGIVYLDPTNLNTVCTESQAGANLNENSTPTGIDSGCMKFYVYRNDKWNDQYKAILDHNTTPVVVWNSNNVNNYELSNVKDIIDDLNESWDYEVGIMTGTDIEDLTGVSFSTRENFYFNSKGLNPSAIGKGTSSYAWLYDYTKNCEENGCNIQDNNSYIDATDSQTYNTLGYWVNSIPRGTTGNSTHYVGNDDYQGFRNVSDTRYGVRPVIAIPYSRIENVPETVLNNSPIKYQTFYAVGNPENNSTERYPNITDLPSLGKNVFVKYENYGLANEIDSACISYNNKVECFTTDYDAEINKFTSLFDNCSLSGTSYSCQYVQGGCLFTNSSTSTVGCGGSFGSCFVSSTGQISCSY